MNKPREEEKEIGEWFVGEPSNEDEPCLKIKTGSGPFAYRNVDLEDLEQALTSQREELLEKIEINANNPKSKLYKYLDTDYAEGVLSEIKKIIGEK